MNMSRKKYRIFILVLFIIMIIPLSQSKHVSAISGSEWLNVNGFDSTYAIDPVSGWNCAGASPYLDAQDESTNIIYTKIDNSDVGWFDFPSTTLTGTLTVNISIYCKNDDGTGNDKANVFVDYVGGGGSDVGDIGQHTTYSYDTISLGTHTVTEVNALRVYFNYEKVTAADEVYIDHVRLGVSGEQPEEGINYEEYYSESLMLDDTTNIAVDYSTGFYESILAQDATYFSVDFVTKFFEELLAYDSTRINVDFVIRFFEGITTYDSVYSSLSFLVSLYENVIVSSMTFISIDFSVVINEAIQISSSVMLALSYIIRLFESVAIVSSITVALQFPFFIHIFESILISDTGFYYAGVVTSVNIFESIVINNCVIQVGLMMQYINWFSELFLSTDIWGWFGPLIIIGVSFIILTNKKLKPLGILFIIVEFLITSIYLDLVSETPWYWWNIIIMILGIIICIGQMWSK